MKKSFLFNFMFLICSFAATFTWAANPPAAAQQAHTAATQTVRVHLVPFKIEGQLKYETFLKKIESNVLQAKADKADLVVFPELFVADLVEAAEKTAPLTQQFEVVAKEITPKLIADFERLAKTHQINIVGGSFPRKVKNETHNTAIFVSAKGEVKFQDKVYLTPDEKDWGWKGGDTVQVWQTDLGRIAILICYDVEMPQITDRLAALNPEILIVPSMTDTEAGFRRVRWTAQARAIEHRAYVVHVGTTGTPDPSWPHYAQASALTPSEKDFTGLLVEGKVNSSAPLAFNLDLTKLRAARAKRGIHPAKDQTERQLKLKVL